MMCDTVVMSCGKAKILRRHPWNGWHLDPDLELTRAEFSPYLSKFVGYEAVQLALLD